MEFNSLNNSPDANDVDLSSLVKSLDLDTVRVKEHYRSRPVTKVFGASVGYAKKKCNPKHDLRTLMDVDTFRVIIKHQSEEIANFKKQKQENRTEILQKQKWSTFMEAAKRVSKKKKRTKKRFVWERKLLEAKIIQKQYIERLNNLKEPMLSSIEDDYFNTSKMSYLFMSDEDDGGDSSCSESPTQTASETNK